MSTPNWAIRGFDRPMFSNNSKMRHWMPKNSEKIIVMLTEVPFCVYEHSLRTGEKTFELWTCIRNIDSRGCPLDEVSKPYYVGFGTCIDTSSWKRRDGTVVKNQRRLLPMRGQSLEYFEKLRSQAGGNLRGGVFKVTRGAADKSWSIGDRWEIQRVLSEAELVSTFGAENVKELNYAQILQPKAYEMIMGRAKRAPKPDSDQTDLSKILAPQATPVMKAAAPIPVVQNASPNIEALLSAMQPTDPEGPPEGDDSDSEEVPF